MEVKWSKEFGFENEKCLWTKIYSQKVILLFDKKLSEFNFKLLHNIVPCGYVLAKWEPQIVADCDICNVNENVKHMLYDCPSVFDIWELVSLAVGFHIKWKHLVCGFLTCDSCDKIIFYNLIFTIIMYAIFKENSRAKFEQLNYKDIKIKYAVKRNLICYRNVINVLKGKKFSEQIYMKMSLKDFNAAHNCKG